VKPEINSNPFAPLIDAIVAGVVDRLGSSSGGPRLLNVEGAAAYLSMTEDALRHKVANRKIPAVRADRHLRFDVRDLDAWIEENKAL
jgi:excisionase family DNA binding protein